MPNYMRLIGEHFPTVGATCEGDPSVYGSIVWVDGDALPTQAALDAKYLDEYKQAKIAELSAACAYDIVNGFQSDADGLHAQARWYDSAPEDQVNLMGSVTVGDAMLYPSRDTQSGAKVYVSHTHLQLQQVLRDGRDIKLAKLQSFTTKQATVMAATDTAGVDAVTWP